MTFDHLLKTSQVRHTQLYEPGTGFGGFWLVSLCILCNGSRKSTEYQLMRVFSVTWESLDLGGFKRLVSNRLISLNTFRDPLSSTQMKIYELGIYVA